MKVNFYIFTAFLTLFYFACRVENAKENNISKSLIEHQNKTEKIEEPKQQPEISAIYATHPIYFAKEFTKEATYSYKTVIFFKDGEWARVYSYTGIDENSKYISLDSSEGTEYGNWKNEKGKVIISIKQCKCHHCVEAGIDPLAKSDVAKQKDIKQNWIIQGKFGEEGSFLIYKEKKYKYLNTEEIIINGFRDDLFEMNDEGLEIVPCKILEN